MPIIKPHTLNLNYIKIEEIYSNFKNYQSLGFRKHSSYLPSFVCINILDLNTLEIIENTLAWEE